MKKQPSVIFASRFRALAQSTGATQVALSKTFGVSQASVSKWFNGSVPKPDLLPKIAHYFGVSVDYLFGEEVEREAGITNEVLSYSAPQSVIFAMRESDAWPKKKNEIISRVEKMETMIGALAEELNKLRTQLEGGNK